MGCGRGVGVGGIGVTDGTAVAEGAGVGVGGSSVADGTGDSVGCGGVWPQLEMRAVRSRQTEKVVGFMLVASFWIWVSRSLAPSED
jgi:hypothetical protein